MVPLFLCTIKRIFVSNQIDFSLVDFSDVDIYTPLGWRGLIHHGNEPFIGFGHCNVTLKVTVDELDKASKSPQSLVEFYLATLRTDCDEKQKEQVLSLIAKKHLQMNKNGTFSIPAESPLA